MKKVEILTEIEAKVIEYLNNGHPYADVAKVFNVTKERIKQVESKAREKIRIFHSEHPCDYC